MKRIHLVAMLLVLSFLILTGATVKRGPGHAFDAGTGTMKADKFEMTTTGAHITSPSSGQWKLTRPSGGGSQIFSADGGVNASLTIRAGGNGALILGSSSNAEQTLVTAGGTVNVDGYVQAQKKVVSLASGTITLNAITLATGDGSVDMDVPDSSCDAAGDIGNWFTIVVEDASTVHSIQVLDASNILIVEGLAQSAGEEVDSCASGTENEGCSITFTCLAAEQWYSTARVGTWQVGGTAD